METQYSKIYLMQVLRSKHKVRLYIGGKAGELKKALGNVPDAAILDDLDEEDGIHSLYFISEEQIKD